MCEARVLQMGKLKLSVLLILRIAPLVIPMHVHFNFQINPETFYASPAGKTVWLKCICEHHICFYVVETEIMFRFRFG